MGAFERFRTARAGVADAMTAANAAVADLRSTLAEVEDEIEAVEKRPFSKAEVLAKAERDLADHAGVGRVLLKRAAQRAALGEGQDLLSLVTEPKDVRAILAAVAGPAVLSVYAEEVAARWGDDAGLTDDEREAELVRLHQVAFDIELLEEKILREAEAAGIRIERRRDMHPAAILARDEDLPA